MNLHNVVVRILLRNIASDFATWRHFKEIILCSAISEGQVVEDGVVIAVK